jgi:antitoxin component YwqK of YwqJK toxin-antitoxin module
MKRPSAPIKSSISFSALVVLAVTFSGSVLAEPEFKCLDGAKDPAPYKPGNVVRWCEIWKDDRLVYHGSVWRWYPSGQPQSREFYVFGNAEGEWPSWYENGKMSSLGTFKDGTKVGTWKYWNDSGQLTTEVSYSATTNTWKEYYLNGSTKAIGATVRSGKVGSWTYWKEDGTEKASCDFGDGLFSLPTQACREIADDLEPKGYSPPVPRVSLASKGDAVIKLGSQTYSLIVPHGWKADTEVGKNDEIPLAMVPEGGKWQDSGPNMYVRFLYKQGHSFAATIASEQENFQENVADFEKMREVKSQLKNIGEVVTETVRYKPEIATDSPFSITASNTVQEQISYVNVSPEVVLMTVLVCGSDLEAQKSSSVRVSLLQSLRVFL